MLDVLNMQKSNYVRNASVEELAQYVSEPNLKVNHFDATVGGLFFNQLLARSHDAAWGHWHPENVGHRPEEAV